MAAALSIFSVIHRGDLAKVQRRVAANPAVMEERDVDNSTPLIHAIRTKQPAIALWLIQHRGDHDLSTQDDMQNGALHWACVNGPLSVAQTLVQAGADPTRAGYSGRTPLHYASLYGRTGIVTYLLSLPAVHASIDATSDTGRTALSYACDSISDPAPIVRLLLDAGANPAIPDRYYSPLSRAAAYNRHDIAVLLGRAIAEPRRPRLLFKARAIVDATFAIRKAQHDSVGRTRGEVRRNIIAAAPEYLRGRVAEGKPLPRVEVKEENDEEQQAVLAYTLGMAYGEKGDGLPREVFTELLEMMVPRWDAEARRPPA